MTDKDGCIEPAYHQMHICILKHIDSGQAAELAASQAFRCSRCGEYADSPRNLCQPVSMHGE